VGDFQIGPYFLPAHLNGRTYADFIENRLPDLLKDIPLRERETLIFQNDEAPAHYSRRGNSGYSFSRQID